MNIKLVLATVLALALAACGSPGGGSTIPGAGTLMQAGTMNLTVVKAPAATTTAARRARPDYVASTTAKLVVTFVDVNGSPVPTGSAFATPTTVSLTGCSSTCSASISAPIGTDEITFLAEDASGVALSQTPTYVSENIASGTNNVSVTLDPIVASLVFAPAAFSTPYNATASAPTSLEIKDPDGNIIVGPGAFLTPAGVADPVKVTCTGQMDLLTSIASGSLPESSPDTLLSAGDNNIAQVSYWNPIGTIGTVYTCTATDTAGLTTTETLTLTDIGSGTMNITIN